METIRINRHAKAFIRVDEGVNAGLLTTSEGMVLIDTTSTPAEARSLLDAAGASVEDVRLVVNTHFHTDHTWGNQLFSCPIVSHRYCLQHMRELIQTDWSMEGLRAYSEEVGKTDPLKAIGLRNLITELRITVPDTTFDDRYQGELGALAFEVLHLGGHTPDLSVVWLPESRVLFASDLIFQGRYPFIFDADIPAWIAQLSRLLEFNAEATVPGHGVMCGVAEIIALRTYLEDTWELTRHHLQRGHGQEETAADPGFPVFSPNKYQRLHQTNIRFMYQQLLEKTQPG